MSSEDNYIPGVCNIGNEQLAKRKRFLAICLAVTFLAAMAIYFFEIDGSIRWIMFIPFCVSAMATQQVMFKFCYRFGLTGLYGFGKVGYDKKVPENQFRELDRKKSMKMLVNSLVIGILLTTFFYFA